MKHFYHLLGNTIVSTLTTMTVWFALIFYVYLQTQAVITTALMSGIYLAVVALTGIWFGSLVDHHRKKNVMMASNVVSLLFFIVCFFIYSTAPTGAFAQLDSVRLWVFIPLVLFGVLVGNIRGIALPTVISMIVPEKNRDKANGLAGTATGIAFLLTSVVSGFLVGHSGMYWVLILAMVLIVVALVDLWLIPIPEKKIVRSEHDESKKVDLRGTMKVIQGISGLLPLILFTMINNFLGGVFMSLMDAYGLSLVSVQVWGVLWGVLSCAFILGGFLIAKFGLGKNPLRALFIANITIWLISCFFTVYPSVVLLAIGMFIYLAIVPFIEAAEHTIIQKLVPLERQGRVFGFAQSIEQSASPLMAFAIGPIAQFIVIPFMTTGAGVELIGSWFGTGPDRGIALVFTVTGVIGLTLTLLAMNSKYYRQLSERYLAS